MDVSDKGLLQGAASMVERAEPKTKPLQAKAFSRSLSVCPDVPDGLVCSDEAAQVYHDKSKDLSVFKILSPRLFVQDRVMLSARFLESQELDHRAISARMKLLKHDPDSDLDNGGLTYWQHVIAQQEALKKLADMIRLNPSEAIFMMERGGTNLYDMIDPYRHQTETPLMTVSLSKHPSKIALLQMEFLAKEMDKAYQAGMRQLGITEVCISGGQVNGLARTLEPYLKYLWDAETVINIYCLRQSLTLKKNKVFRLNAVQKLQKQGFNVNLFMADVPCLLAEDVAPHLEYGATNQYPVNLIMPDGQLLQLFSSDGTRKTMQHLSEGKYNAVLEEMCGNVSEMSESGIEMPEADSLGSLSSESSSGSTKKTGIDGSEPEHWTEKFCFGIALQENFNLMPERLQKVGNTGVEHKYQDICTRMTWLARCIENETDRLLRQYGSMAGDKYRKRCKSDIQSITENLRMPNLQPVLIHAAVQRQRDGKLDIAQIFRKNGRHIRQMMPFLSQSQRTIMAKHLPHKNPSEPSSPSSDNFSTLPSGDAGSRPSTPVRVSSRL